LSADFYWALPSRAGGLDPVAKSGPAQITDALTLSPSPARRYGTILRRLECTAVFRLEERMAKTRSANSDSRFYGLPVEDQRTLTFLRRLVIEIEDSIAQSRAVILSTRDAIELLERLEGRQFSN
jgi:hypothetical protein